MLNRIVDRIPSRALTVMCVAAVAGTAYSQQTIRLPGDFSTLQDALNPAVSGIAPGDSIVLSDAVSYLGTFTVVTPGLTIRAAAGESPVLDANGPGTVVTVQIGGGSLTLEGLIIQDGTNQNTAQRGSGVEVVEAGLVTIRDCTIRNNSSDGGGGLYAEDTDVVVEDSRFLNNTAVHSGGMYVEGSSDVVVRGTVFSNNTAITRRGGGLNCILTSGGTVVVEGSEFTDNSANEDGGAASFSDAGSVTLSGTTFARNTAIAQDNTDGGAVRLEDIASATIRGCVFDRNLANGSGGALYTITNDEDDRVSFIESRFVENEASNGGGVIVLGGTADFAVCEFVRNSANRSGDGDHFGGAVRIRQADSAEPEVRIFNSVFDGNTAGLGGAVNPSTDSSTDIVNSTFVGNVASSGGGAIRSTSGSAEVRVYNSIFAGNLPAGDQVDLSTSIGSADVRFNLFDTEGLAGDGSDNLFNSNPLFADRAGGDYSLLAGSPSIDAGSSTLYGAGPLIDFAGNARGQDDPDTTDTGESTLGPVIDMGAFEFNIAGGNAACPADLAAPEGVLDLNDITTFIEAFSAGCP